MFLYYLTPFFYIEHNLKLKIDPKMFTLKPEKKLFKKQLTPYTMF